MIHTEHLRKADESYAIRHDNKGNAVHEYRRGYYYYIFPTLDDFARYVYLGDQTADRFPVQEEDLNELYESDVYEYFALRKLAENIWERRIVGYENETAKLQLLEKVIEQIQKDIECRDVTALEELLRFVPVENLKGYLPE